jgi:xylulokinase
VFLDAAGAPVRPTIVTHDSRLGGSLAELARSGALDEIVRISGSRVMTGHFPPIYHLVRTLDPDAIEHTRWLVLAKDYLRYRLTGEIGTEICDATGTNLIAMPGQTWSKALCSLLSVPRQILPAIGRADQIAGHVTPDAARACGLAPGTPVVYGGGDSHCALLGLGIVGSGEAGLLLGTNSTLRASFDGLLRPLDQMVWLQQHVVPGRFTVSASSMAGSSALAWFKGLCVDDPAGSDSSTYQALDALAAGVPAGADGLLFHPYLFGERSPFYNPEARASFLGLRHWHGRGHMVRAIMEGVAFAVRNCFDAIQTVARQRDEAVAVIRTGESGGSQLPTWRQIVTDALDHPLEIVAVDEPGCLGAALLAAVGTGVYESLPAAIQQTVRVAACTTPDPDNAARYRDQRAAFNDTYQALESRLYSQDLGFFPENPRSGASTAQ